MAAAYLFHITRNHPFIDGNKRTGAVASVVFLIMNGIELNANEDSFEKLVRSVAEGKTDKAAITKFFKTNTSLYGIDRFDRTSTYHLTILGETDIHSYTTTASTRYTAGMIQFLFTGFWLPPEWKALFRFCEV